MHFSALKKIGITPLDYALGCQENRDDTVAFRIGRAVHALWLQDIMPVLFEGRRVANAVEKHIEALGLSVDPSDVLSPAEYATVMHCVKALRASKLAMDTLERCPNRETSHEWTIDIDGVVVPCAGRVDAWGPRDLLELKTTQCARPAKFLLDAQKFAYHAQLAWYDIALGTQFIEHFTAWRRQTIVAVETKPPYHVTVIELAPLRIDQGYNLFMEWLAKWKECTESGVWPSYSQEIVQWDAEVIYTQENEDENDN